MKCAVCTKEADKVCSGCQNVSYCCLDHQKADWKKHKNLCAPYSVSIRNGVKVLTLRKDVPQGTILLEETPLIHIAESNGVAVDSFCLVCGLHMTPLTANRCTACTWPICGIDCESHSMHKENECNILASSKYKYEPKMFNELSSIITEIRAMTVKTIYPNIWNDLKALLLGTTPFDDEWISENEGIYKRIAGKILPHSKDRKEAIDDGLTLSKVCMRRSFYFNGQDIVDFSELRRTGKWRSGYYVYKKASLVSHSCAPNCVWNNSNFPDFKIRIRAAYPLKKGEVITVSHLDYHAEARKGTAERLLGHVSRFGEICKCRLCLDPTEFGTYISAVVCEDCRGPNSKNRIQIENSGYLLPQMVGASGTVANIPFRCNACQKVIELTEMITEIEKITKDLEEHNGKSIDFNSTEAVNVANSFIAKYRDAVLHPNHWLIHKATLILIDDAHRVLSSQVSHSDKDVEDLLAHCDFILKILNQLHPGFSTMKSTVMVNKAAAISFQIHRAISKAEKEKELGDLLKFSNQLLALKRELLEYYKDDFPVERGRVRSEMADKFENDIDKLTSVLITAGVDRQMPN